jgi:AraC-like DNA-binding protein
MSGAYASDINDYFADQFPMRDLLVSWKADAELVLGKGENDGILLGKNGQLAKRFFVSKYYLCRAFKKHNGISVHGYVNQKRVMYAKQLIESGETASSAAYRVGFGDYSAFYRAYVKIVGRSPSSHDRGTEEK